MTHLRADGRARDQLRDLRISFDGLRRVDGSASFSFGDTKAIASVSGPIEVRLANEQASRATFEVIIRPLSNVPGTESKSLSSTIRSLLATSMLLSHNPRTLVQLVIQALTPSPVQPFQPTLIASMINASTLALLNCGSVPMRGVVCAVAIGRLSTPHSRNSWSLVVDPGDDELCFVEGGGTFAFLASAGLDSPDTGSPVPSFELAWSDWRAATSFDEKELVQAGALAKTAAAELWLRMKQSVDGMDTGKSTSQGNKRQSLDQDLRGENSVGMVVDDDRMEI